MAIAPDTHLEIDARAFERVLRQLDRPARDEAVTLALVDTAKYGKSQAAKSIARSFGLTQKRVRGAIYYDRIAVGDTQAVIRSSRKYIPLINFKGTRQNKTGVITRARGESETLASAFIATMPRTGHRGVFRRVGRPRLPIRQLYGPSVWDMFASTAVRMTVGAALKARIGQQISRRVARALRSR